MASKIIFDSPALLDESLISLTEACRLFPTRCSRAALERWIRRGSRGVVLESVLVCGRRQTSREAISRFIRAQLHIGPDRPEAKKGSMSKKELADKAARYGLTPFSDKDVN